MAKVPPPRSRVHLAALVAATLAACEPDVDRSGGAPDVVAVPRDTASSDVISPGTAIASDTAVVARTPATDPWLFEGIPNFEDLVATRDGDWLVVLGSVGRDGAAPRPTIMRAADDRIAAVQQRAWNARMVPFAVASEELPAFAPGLTVLVLGPHARADAERRLTDARVVAPDAYLKAGW